jgi:predicted enzyme related to lactoylglutathione lyase
MLEQFPIRVRLPASDIERAKTWYREKLGLTPEKEHLGHLRFKLGSGTELIIYTSPTTAGTAKNTQAEFTVQGIESVMENFRSNGVQFDELDLGPVKTVNGLLKGEQFGKSAWFKDSEGNTIQLSEPNW